MGFNKPCIKCGVLSKDAMCRNCHRGQERIRDRIRDQDPARKYKKATLYGTAYRKQRELLKDYNSGELPPVEVKTDKFRAVAKNFFTMPIQLLMDLKAAQLDNDGSEILILFDACEMAFSEEDFDRLADLNIKDFIDVVHAWVNWNQKPHGVQ